MSENDPNYIMDTEKAKQLQKTIDDFTDGCNVFIGSTENSFFAFYPKSEQEFIDVMFDTICSLKERESESLVRRFIILGEKLRLNEISKKKCLNIINKN
jgi:hypothetical protein